MIPVCVSHCFIHHKICPLICAMSGKMREGGSSYIRTCENQGPAARHDKNPAPCSCLLGYGRNLERTGSHQFAFNVKLLFGTEIWNLTRNRVWYSLSFQHKLNQNWTEEVISRTYESIFNQHLSANRALKEAYRVLWPNVSSSYWCSESTKETVEHCTLACAESLTRETFQNDWHHPLIPILCLFEEWVNTEGFTLRNDAAVLPRVWLGLRRMFCFVFN